MKISTTPVISGGPIQGDTVGFDGVPGVHNAIKGTQQRFKNSGIERFKNSGIERFADSGIAGIPDEEEEGEEKNFSS